jgi:3-deoxy-manno-octulosonate cytidylyltransferase (CMP-KDO synthetase)
MKKIILIPTRINSTRLPAKALLELEGKPIIIHTFKRAQLSNLADDVYVCTDSEKIINVCKKYKAKFIKTKSSHKNGTERIAEAAIKLGLKNQDIIIDVQGDEPLINPKDIDNTIKFFLKKNFDIVVPHINVNKRNNLNIVKILVDNKQFIKWMSRSDLPHYFKANKILLKKHLSIIVFKNSALLKYYKLKMGYFEKIESIELLRAIENGMNLGSNKIDSDSFSVDVIDDFRKAKEYIKKDKIKKKYKD